MVSAPGMPPKGIAQMQKTTEQNWTKGRPLLRVNPGWGAQLHFVSKGVLKVATHLHACLVCRPVTPPISLPPLHAGLC